MDLHQCRSIGHGIRHGSRVALEDMFEDGSLRGGRCLVESEIAIVVERHGDRWAVGRPDRDRVGISCDIEQGETGSRDDVGESTGGGLARSNEVTSALDRFDLAEDRVDESSSMRGVQIERLRAPCDLVGCVMIDRQEHDQLDQVATHRSEGRAWIEACEDLARRSATEARRDESIISNPWQR